MQRSRHTCPGGETGRHSGLKIRRTLIGPCRFESGPGHYAAVAPLALARSAITVDLADPYATAKAYVENRHAVGDSYTLWYSRGAFYSWRSSHYIELPTDEIRQMLYEFLSSHCVAVKDGAPIKASRAVIDNLLGRVEG